MIIWFPNDVFIQTNFLNICEDHLTPDVRRFLNCFNNALGDNQTVFSMEAISLNVVEVDLQRSSESVKLWVDFNLSVPSSICVFCNREGTEGSQLIEIEESQVMSATLTQQTGDLSIRFTLASSPFSHNNECKAVFVFAATEARLEGVLSKMLGERFFRLR